MEYDNIQNVYLVGIGGIGMSALARYFKTQGKFVAGYDRNASELTEQLAHEGMDIHFDDSLLLVPECILSQKESTLIVYTPAVPHYHYEFNYFIERGYLVKKRAEVLGEIFSSRKGVAVAGTHGKTTTSTMIAHLLKQSKVDCSAFLGGISKNYNTNLLLSTSSDIIVAEADEYDRSFLRLFPQIAVITSVDADHLDVYGTHEEVIKSFYDFASQIRPGGTLIYKKGIKLDTESIEGITKLSYSSVEQADFCAENVHIDDGMYIYDLHTPTEVIKRIHLGIPGAMNLENSVAAAAVASLLGVSHDEIKNGLTSFVGVKRRFDYHIRSKKIVYIDDYAHHPEELSASINAVKTVFPNRMVTGIFQPHLFTRTRDFAPEFAKSLSMLDRLVLLEIYPAREDAIPGITSNVIYKDVTLQDKLITKKEDLLQVLNNLDIDVLITMGAGDIDKYIKPITDLLKKKYNV